MRNLKSYILFKESSSRNDCLYDRHLDMKFISSKIEKNKEKLSSCFSYLTDNECLVKLISDIPGHNPFFRSLYYEIDIWGFIRDFEIDYKQKNPFIFKEKIPRKLKKKLPKPEDTSNVWKKRCVEEIIKLLESSKFQIDWYVTEHCYFAIPSDLQIGKHPRSFTYYENPNVLLEMFLSIIQLKKIYMKVDVSILDKSED